MDDDKFNFVSMIISMIISVIVRRLNDLLMSYRTLLVNHRISPKEIMRSNVFTANFQNSPIWAMVSCWETIRNLNFKTFSQC